MTSKDLKQQLRKRQHLETTDGHVYLTEDPMASLLACHLFMVKALNGDYAFNLVNADSCKKRTFQQRLGRLFPCIRRYSDVYVPGMVYEPSIAFFLEQYRGHPISQLSANDRPNTVLASGQTAAEVFVDFISMLNINADRVHLRKKISDHFAKIAKNQKALKRWDAEVFRRCSRPVFVRLDLGLLSALLRPEELKDFLAEEAGERLAHHCIYHSGEDLDGRALPKMLVGFDEVQKLRVKLFANMKGKPSLFKHLIGYVWRIEYGHKSGFHVHVALAFDGACVHKHEWLAQEIGKYWVNDITQGRGRFHNCNLDWDKDAARYGLGAISWHDDHHRGNLSNHVLPYLAKFDQYVLARPYKGCKLMGTGFVHRAKPTNRGRPRSAVDHRPQPPAL